jgi:hypothetical protein
VYSECVLNKIGSMFFEYTNSNHYIQQILTQLFTELTSKEKLLILIFDNKRLSAHQAILSEVGELLRSWRPQL